MAQSWPDYTHVGRLYISFYPALNNIKKKNKRKNTNTNTNKSARPCPPATGFRWLAALRPPSCEAPASRCLRRGASAPPCYASVLLRSPAAFWLFLFFFFFFVRLPPTTMKVIPPPRAQHCVWLRCHAPLSLLPSRLVRTRGCSAARRRSHVCSRPQRLVLPSQYSLTPRVTAALQLAAGDHARSALLYRTTLCPHSTGLALNSLPRIKMHDQLPPYAAKR